MIVRYRWGVRRFGLGVVVSLMRVGDRWLVREGGDGGELGDKMGGEAGG